MEIINTGNFFVNSYLIKPKDYYILVDTGYQNGFKKFCKKIESAGIVPQYIKYIFITHAHNDHVGFLNELLNYTDALVILHEIAAERLKLGKNIPGGYYTSKRAKGFFSIFNSAVKNDFMPVDEPDRYIKVNSASQPFMGLDIPAQLLMLPGHTADSIGLLLNDGKLFCGDAAMNGFPSKFRYSALVEDIESYKKSWDIMLGCNPSLIYPGHGKPFSPLDLLNYKNAHNGRLYPV